MHKNNRKTHRDRSKPIGYPFIGRNSHDHEHENEPEQPLDPKGHSDGALGRVAPGEPAVPSAPRLTRNSAAAPAHCAAIYGTTWAVGKRPTDQKAIVTAGLM